MIIVEASAALTDGASIATIVGAIIAFFVAIAPGIVALRRSAAAKIAAANADHRAEEAEKRAEKAIRIADAAMAALAGLNVTSAEQLEDERAERDAPEILQTWINSTLADGQNRESHVLLSEQMYRFVHPCIADRRELFAAKLAWKHKDVAHVMKKPELGKPFELLIYNPKSTAPRWRDDDVR